MQLPSLLTIEAFPSNGKAITTDGKGNAFFSMFVNLCFCPLSKGVCLSMLNKLIMLKEQCDGPSCNKTPKEEGFKT